MMLLSQSSPLVLIWAGRELFSAFQCICAMVQGLWRGKWENFFRVTGTFVYNFFWLIIVLSIYWNTSSCPQVFWVESFPFILYISLYSQLTLIHSHFYCSSLFLPLACLPKITVLFCFGCWKGSSISRVGICHSELARAEMKKRWSSR